MIESGFVLPTLTLVALATLLPAVAFALIMIFLRLHPRQAAGGGQRQIEVAAAAQQGNSWRRLAHERVIEAEILSQSSMVGC